MSTQRVIAVWPHATRPEIASVAGQFIDAIAARNIMAVAPSPDLADLGATSVVGTLDDQCAAELAVVFGGDGSILRAAEWALPRGVPLLGVNMGHIGFLAELERSDLDQLVEAVVDQRYEVEERLTIGVLARDEQGGVVWESDAINEVSMEKSARERMLEVLVKIEGLPLSRWGCDGVLVATPTGSTAYALSAGGPVVWPDVDALMIVPISAHALFNRPVVISPDSTVEVTLVESVATEGVVWCDGRRTTPLRGGMRLDVTRGAHRLRLARLSEQPFTNRLVRKFGLRVEGWRGAAEIDTEVESSA